MCGKSSLVWLGLGMEKEEEQEKQKEDDGAKMKRWKRMVDSWSQAL